MKATTHIIHMLMLVHMLGQLDTSIKRFFTGLIFYHVEWQYLLQGKLIIFIHASMHDIANNLILDL